MDWVRGEEIGRGSFATISRALPRKGSIEFPSLMVVKSSEASCSASLKNEKQVLDRIGTCPQIVRCFREDFSHENGVNLHNLLFEFASGGCLADQVKKHGGRLPESEIRRYTRSVLRGISFVHSRGFVHCDVKLQNILLFDNGVAKIADFGLSKEAGEIEAEEEKRCELRGTPLYMSPESVKDGEFESPADIWALGCAVAEMVTGKPVWNHKPGANIWSLLIRIGMGEEVPQIPGELSEEGKDFLGKCFVNDPRKRWTAEMLLRHPFIGDSGEDDTVLLKDSDEFSSSPRGPFDFQDWVSTSEPSTPFSEIYPESEYEFLRELNSKFDLDCSTGFSSPADRIQQLVHDFVPDWSVADSWVTVR
ncbi:hypothetical protein UlMin_039230 [Ulmus minor]